MNKAIMEEQWIEEIYYYYPNLQTKIRIKLKNEKDTMKVNIQSCMFQEICGNFIE